ncbi:ABC transporter substrate-binding protein [Clostridium grantii]|uniref:Carbohydrate ABC transporter substrate-binding protein, CUT1 family (TC 3.A.1.1.-) n=1 Tax=Clostridium grantii DSM 8605 TaxID=1121316 RepID=A0A1M5WAI3_9CLOT|nr:extracellular solute-binding protein [Clostridium grantii]SHH84515.1 carbohydrate ABC transporter substrate-binding protein, CUT1 family (TC 3.A.1.1.-) [Clostridium grantii DSM 8605]
MIRLKGMTWSHARGIKPLEAAAASYKKMHPDIEITWAARSLSDFELFPLDQLATEYDLIMIDHPHIGTAYAQELLVPLDTVLPIKFLKDQRKNSVGKSYESYNWEGHQWALPADAAAQVGAYRKDIFEREQLKVPITWEEVFKIADSLPTNCRMGIPFVPVHAYSSFFSLCSQLSNELFWSNGVDLDLEVGKEVLKLLQRILSKSHIDSYDCDPINMLDKMCTTEEIAYIPLVYGYSNYSRAGYLKHFVNFVDMPSDTGIPEGSMIGGVGLSISSKCVYPNIASDFIKMCVDPAFQCTTFYDNAGQPGHRAAWIDEKVNKDCNDFFINTLKTLDNGSMRPRFNGYISFQEQAGTKIRQFVMDERTDYHTFINELNILIKTCKIND